MLAALAVPAPTWVLAAVNFLAGAGLAVHLALWFTVFQQQIPEHAQSRVSSYDALGSFVVMPVGQVLAGPLAAAVGLQTAIWIAVATFLAAEGACLLVRDVRTLERTDLATTL